MNNNVVCISHVFNWQLSKRAHHRTIVRNSFSMTHSSEYLFEIASNVDVEEITSELTHLWLIASYVYKKGSVYFRGILIPIIFPVKWIDARICMRD